MAISLKDVLASYLLKKARGSLDRAAVEEFAEGLGRPERDGRAAPVESPDGFGFSALATYLLEAGILVYTSTLRPTSQLPGEHGLGGGTRIASQHATTPSGPSTGRGAWR